MNIIIIKGENEENHWSKSQPHFEGKMKETIGDGLKTKDKLLSRS